MVATLVLLLIKVAIDEQRLPLTDDSKMILISFAIHYNENYRC